MAKVEFLGPINRDPIDVNISQLSELKELFIDDIEIQKWLANSAVAVNDSIVSSLDIKISPNDKISLLPPVCGG